MKRKIAFAAVAALLLSTAPRGEASTISLTPTDIHGDDTNTASFTDGNLTLTPLNHDGAGFVPTTFSGGPPRLGIDDPGTSNNNAFNDPDTIVGNAGDEALEYDFAAGWGLSQVTYDFSRADGPGPNDGVVFSGFTENPVVSLSVVEPDLFAIWDGVDSVRVNIPGRLFGGTVVAIDFNNPAASDGQTILMTVNDTTQAGAQLAIRGISYQSIPEPSALALVASMLAFVARRR